MQNANGTYCVKQIIKIFLETNAKHATRIFVSLDRKYGIEVLVKFSSALSDGREVIMVDQIGEGNKPKQISGF